MLEPLTGHPRWLNSEHSYNHRHVAGVIRVTPGAISAFVLLLGKPRPGFYKLALVFSLRQF